jgi:UDP-glucose 4-epimerase
MARILLTGGAGFIGSHTACVLIEAGHDVVLFDDFSNAARDVPARIGRIAGVAPTVIEGDIRDRAALDAAFGAAPVDAVVHFAAKKAVGESEAEPLLYFDINVVGTIRLLEAMRAAGVGRIVFSSSATVYGAAENCPIGEDAPLGTSSVYGATKLAMERLIGEVARVGQMPGVAILRYFNPVGAHPSALLGEAPSGVPANLMPYLCQVAAGEREELRVFGGDWPTRDGTGVRDYIHVVDLAEAHAAALDRLLAQTDVFTVNLGTGTGYSVLEIIRGFEAATGVAVPYRIVERRPGDVPECYADPSRAESLLGWRARRGLDDMCRDSWAWQQAMAAATP